MNYELYLGRSSNGGHRTLYSIPRRMPLRHDMMVRTPAEGPVEP